MAITATVYDFVLRSGIVIQGTGVVSSSTGQTRALQANGGAAIAKNLIVGSDTTIYGNTLVYNTLTSEFIVINNLTNSTSTTTGSLISLGGAGIGKNLWVGGKINNLTITPPAVNSTLTIADGRTINFPQSLNFPNDLGTPTYLISTDGAGNLSWVAPGSLSAQLVIQNDTSTNATYYPIFSDISSGNISSGYVSTTKLQFNPSTGELSATELNTLSDISLKTNINAISNSLDVISKLDGVTFNWKNNGKMSVGVLAQQVEQVLPQLIGNLNGYKTVNYSGIIGLLIQAIKELNRKIDDLENKN